MTKRVKVFSFDIFDTLILRRVKRPCDIFGVLFERNKAYLGSYFSCEGWIKFRQEIENAARIKKNEANISDIYYAGREYIPSVNFMIEQEFMCECDSCILNDEIVGEIVKAKQQGYKVILISDMYWPMEYIKRLLDNCGFGMELDGIYISCDYGESKATGKLFDIVMHKQNLLPSEIYHTGDNICSDYINPISKGINAKLYTLSSFSEIYFPFLEMEERYYDRLNILPIRLMTGMKGYENNDYWYIIGAMIYAPFVVGALEFVIDIALKEHIERIFPFMREGDFFSEILKLLLQSRNLSFDVKELYVSRRALKKAMEDDQIGNGAIRYFERMGLNEPFITFDIGYAGTTGTLLDNLLRKYGFSTKAVHCLGIEWSTSIQNIIKGHDLRGYIHAENDHEWKDIRAWILEMSFMSEKGKTESYNMDGYPEITFVPYDKEQVANARKCRDGIRDFTRRYCGIKRSKVNIEIVASESHDILSRFFCYPLIKEVNTVGNMVYDEDYFASFSWKVIDDKQVSYFKEKGFLSFEYGEDRRESEWVAGINTLCNPAFSYNDIIYHKLEYKKIECLKKICMYISDLEHEKFFLVGFGFWGREILKYLTVIDKLECLEEIIDNNPSLRGLIVCKKRVISMEDASNSENNNYLLSVQKKEVCTLLERQIYELNNKCKINSIWE